MPVAHGKHGALSTRSLVRLMGAIVVASYASQKSERANVETNSSREGSCRQTRFIAFLLVKSIPSPSASFVAYKGEILGGCFDALAKAMEIRPTINLPAKERMADFHIWGCAIAKALGYTQEDFLNAWAKNIELQHEESLEASPLAVLVSQWFKANPYEQFISGTPSVVFRKLKEQADNAGLDERTLPRSPLAFGRKLQEVRSNLEAHGYAIERTRGKDRTVTIFRPKANLAASNASVTSIADAVSNRSAPTVADKIAQLREGRTL